MAGLRQGQRAGGGLGGGEGRGGEEEKISTQIGRITKGWGVEIEKRYSKANQAGE